MSDTPSTDQPSSNVVAVVALAIGAGAAGAAMLPYTGMVAGPFGVAAVALGVVATTEARRRGRRGVAIAGTALGGLAMAATAAWWLGGPFGPFDAGGVAHERAEITAEPPPDTEAVTSPDADAAAEVEVGHSPESGGVTQGSGHATLTVDGDVTELELTSCDTGDRTSERHLRGEGPDGRIAVDGRMGRTLVAVETEGAQLMLVGEERSASGSGPASEDAGVELALVGDMRDVLSGDIVDVELEAECS